MTAEIIHLMDHRPHLTGPAKCLECKTTWVAVAPVGTCSGLQCPQCSLQKGVFTNLVYGQEVWVCACGCDAFYIQADGPHCFRCGKRSTHDDC